MSAKLIKSRSKLKQRLITIGPNQLSLLKALLFVPENRFPSLQQWYCSPCVVGGGSTSRHQSCWSVINRGWAEARKGRYGGWECTLTSTGRDIAEGRVPYKIRQYLKKNPIPRPLSDRTLQFPGDFDGFLTPKGELVSINDSGRMLSVFANSTENQDQIANNLRDLAEDCIRTGDYRAASDYLQIVASILDDPDEKAECFLRMGQAIENKQDYMADLKSYLCAFELPQKPNDIWYFLNNNVGYCFNQIGRHQDAERYCRAAIEIDPNRHNAHKNLGIALQCLERHADAAKSYLSASKLAPTDPRALALLKDLIANHSGIIDEIPGLLDQFLECCEIAQNKIGVLGIQ